MMLDNSILYHLLTSANMARWQSIQRRDKTIAYPARPKPELTARRSMVDDFVRGLNTQMARHREQMAAEEREEVWSRMTAQELEDWNHRNDSEGPQPQRLISIIGEP
jgi:septal ring factor EnvC (AmiA/AmiB activator)